MSTAVLTQNRIAQREMRSSLYTIVSIAGVGLLLRVYAISLYPLTGDEYGSLADAEHVGLNWNSILYSSLMHFWIGFGSSEVWLRLPAAFFGAATVVILFKAGEKLGGLGTGVIAALLTATSPFNIYHSQEVRFYSFFMCTSAAFMLVTIWYVSSNKNLIARASAFLSGLVLVFSHFLGVLALYAQGASTVLAINPQRSRRKLMLLVLGLPIIAFTLPFIPFVQHKLWQLVQGYGHGTGSYTPVVTRLSLMNLAKVGFAGYAFIFGYHVYPLRLVLVIAGALLTGFLLLAGIVRMWKETRWAMMTLTYSIVLFGVYVVFDSVGGRIASGAAPRHVAFVWPVFLILTAMGVTSFKGPVLHILVASVLTVNALSIWSGWRKDWTYGNQTDYRSAAEYASQWMIKDTAILHDGRSTDPISYYFPKEIPLVHSWNYLEGKDTKDLLEYQRLMFITDDWEPQRRRGFDQLLERLAPEYSLVDGRVDYPLFEYVLERNSSPESSSYALRAESNQVLQPLSVYGLEFQDLRLPVSVKLKDVSLKVIGAYGLPDAGEHRQLRIPLARSISARRVILLSDITVASGLEADQQIGEITVEDKLGKTLRFPLRFGRETESWDKQCKPPANCETVFQWHKRLAIVGQNRYEGAWRDFQAGLHGVVIDLPEPHDVVKLTIRYLANSGHLYVWGIALP